MKATKAGLDGAGQVFSGEFIVGFMLFMTALIVLLNLWSTTTREVLATESQATLEEYGVEAAEKLVRTPGTPLDWTIGDVESLGLANESRMLMPTKVLNFTHLMSDNKTDLCGPETNYDCNLYMLGLRGYNFYLNITYLNKTTVEMDGVSAHTGRLPVGEKDKITVLRTALLQDAITRVYLTVWR
jgi:hypothetical protein